MHGRDMQIIRAGKTFCRPDWSLDTGKLPDYLLWVPIEGRGKMRYRDETIEIIPGNCFLLKKGERYLATQDINDPLAMFWMHFDLIPGKDSLVSATELDMLAPYTKSRNFVFLTQLLERMIAAYYRQHTGEVVSWLVSALMELQHNKSSEGTGALELDETGAFIEKLRVEIREHPEKRYRLNQLAKKICLSRDHFSRLFKARTGQSFRDYLIASRMESAKYYLRSSRYKISRIAEILAYNDVYQFSKQFKKHTGISPSRYQQRNSDAN